jgi:hypothetical protein
LLGTAIHSLSTGQLFPRLANPLLHHSPFSTESKQQSVVFPCSLDSYFRLFLADQASHSVDKYQSVQIGDYEIVTTPWKDVDSDTANLPPGIVISRTFQFFHPLKNSLGPSKAKTTRHQRLQRCGNLGMCWENTTSVEGIPAADCFRVEDRWVFEAVEVSDPTLENGGDDGGGFDSSRRSPLSSYHIKLTVTFRIIFFKRTMLRSLIQKNVKQENRNWVKGYVSMVQQALEAQDIGAVKPAPVSTATPTTQTLAAAAEQQQQPAVIIPNTPEAFDRHPPQSSTVNNAAATAPLVAAVAKCSTFAAVLVCLILTVGTLCLLFLSLQLWGVRQTITLWQTEMELLREQNQVLIAAIQSLTLQYQTACDATNSSFAPPVCDS